MSGAGKMVGKLYHLPPMDPYLPSYTEKIPEPLQHMQMLKRSFRYFVCHIVLESLFGTNWKSVYHITKSFEAQCDYAVALMKGEVKNLAVSIPPRNSKSILWSVALPMFLLANNGAEKIINVSHHDDVLKQFASHRSLVLSHPDYQKIIDWTPTTNTKDELKTSGNGHILCMVILNVITGLGANWIIIDDPIAATNGGNIKHCKKVRKKFTGSLQSRMDNKNTGHFLVISQRVGMVDVIDLVINNKKPYTYLELQAVAEEKQEIVFPASKEVWVRDVGDVLNPLHESKEILEELEAIDPEAFQTQYQQRPMESEGAILSRESLVWYSKPLERYKKIVLSVDSAGSVGLRSSNWGMVVGGVWTGEGGKACVDILFVEAKAYEYPGGKKRVLELVDRFGVDTVLVEAKSTGIALAPELRDMGLYALGVQVKGSKEDRFLRAVPFINNGRLRLPDVEEMPFTNQWLNALLYELVGFPNCPKRDIVDSLVHLIEQFDAKVLNLRAFYRIGPD